MPRKSPWLNPLTIVLAAVVFAGVAFNVFLERTTFRNTPAEIARIESYIADRVDRVRRNPDAEGAPRCDQNPENLTGYEQADPRLIDERAPWMRTHRCFTIQVAEEVHELLGDALRPNWKRAWAQLITRSGIFRASAGFTPMDLPTIRIQSREPWDVEATEVSLLYSLGAGGLAGAATLAGAGALLWLLAWAWVFLLSRVRELSDAIRGKGHE